MNFEGSEWKTFFHGMDFKIDDGVEQMFQQIAQNFVKSLVKNAIPMLVSFKETVINAKYALCSLYNLRHTSGHFLRNKTIENT